MPPLAEQTPKWLENNNNGTCVDPNGVPSANEKKCERKGQIDSFNVIHHRNMLLGVQCSRWTDQGSIHSRVLPVFRCSSCLVRALVQKCTWTIYFSSLFLCRRPFRWWNKVREKKSRKRKSLKPKVPLPCAHISFFCRLFALVYFVSI